MKTHGYSLHITETQARTIIAALDLYSRLGMGQTDRITDHPDWHARRTDEIDELLRRLRPVAFPELPPGGYFSISSREINDSNRVAYDLLQVIRHRLSWEKAGNPQQRDWKTMLGVNYDEPMRFGAEPLAEISILPRPK